MVPYRIRSASCVMLSLITLVTVSACGSSVTGPAPVSNVQGSSPSTGAPPGGTNPTAPTPSPAPTPTPAPVPPGTPPPAESVEYFEAQLSTVHWAGEWKDKPLFGNPLVIELWRSRGELWLHETRLWIVQQSETSVIATDRNPAEGGGEYTLSATLNLKTGQWSFNGIAGSGGGALTPKASR